jgi:hypothetical protein
MRVLAKVDGSGRGEGKCAELRGADWRTLAPPTDRLRLGPTRIGPWKVEYAAGSAKKVDRIRRPHDAN